MAKASIINIIASDQIIDEAYEWVCKRRIDYHYNNDIWHLRTHWTSLKGVIQEKLLNGTYRFEPVRRLRTPGGFEYLWDSMDALVLKAMTLVLSDRLRPFLGDRCYHVSGMGGGKGADRKVQSELQNYNFVFKSDVKGYYASINHGILKKQLSKLVKEEKVLNLLCDFIEHLVDEDGILRLIDQGIHFGSPLSPLLEAIYLKPLDDAMAERNLCYVRYMDDWIILTKNRWQLKRAVKITNQVLNELKVEKHPFKTLFGKVAKGFDFLGYRLAPDDQNKVSVAWRTVRNHLDKIDRLYEQGVETERIWQYI